MTKKKAAKTVWVTWADSESGDHYGPAVFAVKPTDMEYERFWREYACGDFVDENDGPGEWGSYIYPHLEECTVMK